MWNVSSTGQDRLPRNCCNRLSRLRLLLIPRLCVCGAWLSQGIAFVVVAPPRTTPGLVSFRSLTQHYPYPRPPTMNHRNLFSTSLQRFEENGDNDNCDKYTQPNGEVNNDTDKWERLYQQGQARQAQARVPSSSSSDDNQVVSSYRATAAATPIRVVSFDLDNCLWQTGPVIQAANDALAIHLLDVEGPRPAAPRTEIVMKELFQADQQANGTKYGPGKSPVQLTQLRTDALVHILQTHYGYTQVKEAQIQAAAYFDVWTQARHDAITSYLADSAVETLAQIRHSLSLDDNISNNKDNLSPVIMGAITDGNSDPTRIADLAPYFDFVVNAESVGVSKPDPTIFLHAMEHVVTTHQSQLHENDETARLAIAEDQVGPWWVHVGDDFVKDIVAARAMGMRTVWTKEFFKSKPADNKQTTQNEVGTNPQERSVQDFVQQISNMKVVSMQVGAEDYLADSLREEFADATIDSFAELANVLMEWHQQGMTSSQGSHVHEADTISSLTPPASGIDVVKSTNTSQDDNPLQVFFPDSGPATDDRDSSVTSKFCIHCGVKLPAEAKFCSSCGKPQTSVALET